MKRLLFLSLIFLLPLINAYPYQLNLSNGQLIDLNSSDNSTNITIYIIPQNISQSVSITYQNISNNVTSINTTCINCSYYNSTNSNLNNYLTKMEFDSYKNGINLNNYALKSDINNLTKIENIDLKESSHKLLWIVLIIVGIISAINLVTFFMLNQ